MEEETKNDGANISNEQEEEVLETSNEGQVNNEQEEGESIEEYKARLAKAEEIANNYKVRAEKAEKLAKVVKTEVKKEAKSDNMSTKDLYALMEAKVPQDDVDDVVEYAKFKGISVADALKTSFVKTALSDKAEQRRIAEATNVGSTRRGSVKATGDVLISKAQKGELPESEDDMIALIKARKGLK